MPTIQRILVPINGTAESLKALSLASELARTHQAQICLLLVTYFKIETDDNLAYSSWLATPLTGSVSRYVEAVFKRAKDLLLPDLEVNTYHLSGQPATEILTFAKTHDVDLIIMGCRRLSLFSSIINGSTSRQILEKSTCPVLIVK